MKPFAHIRAAREALLDAMEEIDTHDPEQRRALAYILAAMQALALAAPGLDEIGQQAA